MQIYQETKDPSELKDYSFDWAPRLGAGDAVVSHVVSLIDAAGASVPSESVAGNVSRVWFSGGNHGERIVFTVRATTSAGNVLEESFGVDVVDSTWSPPAETGIERLTRYLSEAEAALHQLATGTQIVDLWHDGRRRRYAQQDVVSLQSYVDWLNRQLEAAIATENGRPRRRAIGIAWRN